MAFFSALPGAVAQGLIWGIMAIGVYITYKILDIPDLTVDGSLVTGACVAAVLIVAGVNVWLAMLAAVAAGIIAGLLTGVFHTVLGIPAILSGILTQLILWSVNLKILGKANIGVSSRVYAVALSSTDKGQAILTLVIFCAVLIALLYCFFGTEFGAAMRATGNNPKMSRAQGINTEKFKVIGLMLSNGIVALSGALLMQYQSAADINMGRGAIVIGLAAVIIGEVVFGRIAKNFAVRLGGVVSGGIIYYIVYQVVVFCGIDTDLLKMLSAIVVATFLAVPHLKKKFTKPKIKRAESGVSGDA
ncbi:MAG: ABC transporter permease [Clostridia bacterium]|nr:ABC transporter permease [Clostridia bacterium]MBQ3870313.1 ABC transporter permease [Clostridia bacterium]